MDARRTIDIAIDVDSGRRQVVVDNELSDPDSRQAVNLDRGTQVLFRCTLYQGAFATLYNPPAGSTWLWGVDNVFTPDHTDLATALDADFNLAGDWTETNPTAGKICWRANLATQALKDALASLASATMYADLWMTPPGGSPTLLGAWDVTMRNIAVDPTTAIAVPGVTHLTTEAAAATYVPLWGNQAAWRFTIAKGWQYRFQDDGKWRALIGRLEAGVPVLAWGDPED